MFFLDEHEFEGVVTDALDSIPDELLAGLRNVVVLVEDEPPPDEPDDTLGLYDGVALTDRDDSWGAPLEPDRIWLFRGPLMRMCDSRDELEEEIAITVVHEVAHYFGIDDDQLHAWGWG